MNESKRIDRPAAAVVGLMALVCALALLLLPRLAPDSARVDMEYEAKLFDTDAPLSIDIRMDPAQWQAMLDNAAAEEYYTCDVIVNGTTFSGVGIRPKGNTSLSSIAMDPDTDRYSFKLEFDHFVHGQTCWGLDKLALNNSYADATNMKEAVVYDMFRFLEADASLYNYAVLSVNGDYWGVYLALEAVEDSFMVRSFGVANGALYKPDSMNFGGRESDGGFELPDFSALAERLRASLEMAESTPAPAENTPLPAAAPPAEPEDGAESGSGGASFELPSFGGFGGGSNLNYIDDDLDSYSAIWRSAKTDSTDADHRRVVKALKYIGEGVDLDAYLFIDSALKYMAVHNFSVNGDSLSGSLPHNYYLYESGGRLSVIPWDYNLAFGAHGSYTGSSVVNAPIDEPWSSTHFFDALLENETYRARYHEYYRRLIDEYVLGGGFQAAYDRIRGQIDELVRTDPNALYSYDEYDAAARMLHDLVLLRGESIRGQLDGTIPSTRAAQRAQPDALIDASGIDLRTMGSFMMGGFGRSASGEPESGASGEASGEASEEADAPRAGRRSWTPSASLEMLEASLEMMAASQEMAQAEHRSTVIKNGLTYAGLLLLLLAVFAGLYYLTRRRR